MEDIQDKIDNYLLGRMTNAEAKDFEKEIALDNNVREQFLFTRMVRRELSDHNEKRRSMQQWRMHNPDNRRLNPLRRVLWYSMGGFSAAAMVVLGVFLFQRPQHHNSYPTESSVYAKSIEKQVSKLSTDEQQIHKITAERERLLSQMRSDQRQVSFTGARPVQQTFAAANVSTSSPNNIYANAQYERYMREVEYYQKQAANYRREAEYYKKQAENYEREQQYRLKQAEKYQREAANCSKRGDYDKAKTQTRYAQNEIDKAKTQATYAKSAWDKYKIQMNYAKNADEKAAMYLKYAREALR